MVAGASTASFSEEEAPAHHEPVVHQESGHDDTAALPAENATKVERVTGVVPLDEANSIDAVRLPVGRSEKGTTKRTAARKLLPLRLRSEHIPSLPPGTHMHAR